MIAPRSFAQSLTMLILFSGGVVAQEDYVETLTTSERFGDWILRCEKVKGEKKSCVMTQQIRVGEARQEILQANFAKTEEGTQMTLIFPLGIFLPKGVQIEIVDHLQKNYQITFCNTSGCFVNQLLEPEMIELLRQKEKARMTVYLAPDTPVDVPFSILGFLDAHRKL